VALVSQLVGVPVAEAGAAGVEVAEELFELLPPVAALLSLLSLEQPTTTIAIAKSPTQDPMGI